MKCPNCNETDHEPNAKFCHVCGTPLVEIIKSTSGEKEPPKPSPLSEFTSRNGKGNQNGAKKRQMDSGVWRGILILLIFFFVGFGLYYGFSHFWAYRSYEYVDRQSENDWENRLLDPNKYDYLLTGEPEPEPITGSLTVDSSPQGADIVLDGKKTGLKTPATLDGITEGKHKVTVKQKRIKFSCVWYNIGEDNYSILFRLEEPISIVKR